MNKRRYLWWTAALLVALWLNLGPRPADNSHYQQQPYYQEARARLASLEPEVASGLLSIGLAELDISPPLGHPLAGYGGRRPKAGTALESPCLARALSLQVGDAINTILTADLLLMDEALVQEILRLTGLPRQSIYFTASHSHSCAGGYVEGLIHEQIFGKHDPEWTSWLAGRLAQVVLESRRHFTQVDFAWTSIQVPGSQENRIDRAAPTHDQLGLLLFRTPGSKTPLAILSVFGAHATVFGLRSHLISADYPGHFLEALKVGTKAERLLFAAGSVGDARPHGQALAGKTPQRGVIDYGRMLAEAALEGLRDLKWHTEVQMARLNLPLQLPEVRLPLGPNWTWGPLPTSMLSREIHGREAVLSGLALNDLVLLGFPVDYSGHLASALAARFKNRAGIITTSFNGGYKGYLVASSWFFGHDKYETREVNFFGPWAGDYLNEMAERLGQRLLPGSQSSRYLELNGRTTLVGLDSFAFEQSRCPIASKSSFSAC